MDLLSTDGHGIGCLKQIFKIKLEGGNPAEIKSHLIACLRNIKRCLFINTNFK